MSTTAAWDHEMIQADTYPPLRATLDDDGTLEDADEVTLTVVRALDGSVMLDDVACTIIEARSRQVAYDWSLGTITEPGDFFGQFRVNRPDSGDPAIPWGVQGVPSSDEVVIHVERRYGETWVPLPFSPGANEREVPYVLPGELFVVEGPTRWYADRTYRIRGARASVGTPPVGSAIVVDVDVMGTTIFTDQSRRPRIEVGSNTDLAETPPNISTIVSGQWFTVDVDEIGSTYPGANLTVQIFLMVV